MILITIVRRRTLLEDLPLQAFFFVVLNVVRRAPLGRIAPAWRRIVDAV